MRFENNIAFNNGFGGVVYHKTDRGEMVNNLVFMNGAYPGLTRYSGLTVNAADDLVISNNLVWARDSNHYGIKKNGEATNVTTTHNVVIGKSQFGETIDNVMMEFDDGPDYATLFTAAKDLRGFEPDPLLESGANSPVEIDDTVRALALDFYPVPTATDVVDQGDATYAPNAARDGVSRPQGAAVDVGPYEWVEPE